VGGEQPLVAARDQEVADLAWHRHHPRRVGGVDGQAGADAVRDLGAARHVEPLPGQIADLAHQDQARAPVDPGREVVEGEVVGAGAEHAGLDPTLAQHRGRVNRRRVLQIGEDHVVAGAPLHRAHRLVQALRGVRQEGHLRRRHPEHAGRPGARPRPDREHLLAAGHAAALEGPEPLAGGGVRPEPGRLPAGAEVRHAVQPHELSLVDERHGGPPRVDRL
jgi:hypothetical protein